MGGGADGVGWGCVSIGVRSPGGACLSVTGVCERAQRGRARAHVCFFSFSRLTPQELLLSFLHRSLIEGWRDGGGGGVREGRDEMGGRGRA